MGGPTAHVSLNYRRKKQNTIASTCSMYFRNQQQFSMLCTIISHRNDVIIFKTQVQPFWIISMVDKSTDPGTFLLICVLQ